MILYCVFRERRNGFAVEFALEHDIRDPHVVKWGDSTLSFAQTIPMHALFFFFISRLESRVFQGFHISSLQFHQFLCLLLFYPYCLLFLPPSFQSRSLPLDAQGEAEGEQDCTQIIRRVCANDLLISSALFFRWVSSEDIFVFEISHKVLLLVS